jgi:hypothetical protein
VAEQVAHLGQRHAALDEPGGVLVPQIVPVQVDRAKPLFDLGGQIR